MTDKCQKLNFYAEEYSYIFQYFLMRLVLNERYQNLHITTVVYFFDFDPGG